MDYTEWMEAIGRGFEIVGVAFVAVGGSLGLLRAVWERPGGNSYYIQARRNFGRPLILGLEILIAADIVETVTVDRTLESVAALGILVLVRIVLSFSLETEVEGVVPWRRSEAAGR